MKTKVLQIRFLNEMVSATFYRWKPTIFDEFSDSCFADV